MRHLSLSLTRSQHTYTTMGEGGNDGGGVAAWCRHIGEHPYHFYVLVMVTLVYLLNQLDRYLYGVVKIPFINYHVRVWLVGCACSCHLTRLRVYDTTGHTVWLDCRPILYHHLHKCWCADCFHWRRQSGVSQVAAGRCSHRVERCYCIHCSRHQVWRGTTPLMTRAKGNE